MINIGESRYPQVAVLWELEDHDNYAIGKIGTSRKDKASGEYKNTTWSFVRFVTTAHRDIVDVELKSRFIIKSGGISQEPYMKDGVKTWPKYPQMVIFAIDEFVPNDNNNDRTDSPPEIEEDSAEETEYPF